ncbi:MAG: radical SAM family heme chaperone HemW [Lentimicrobiaceae bacterium]|nr:radical SAM family heme chaperone HemW [Lentimicrobiaceae bacterium]
MAGIYIHIPYCRQKCHYCNFFSVASRSTMPAMVNAICHEMTLQREYTGAQTIETLYFGGGTPSMLGPEMLEQLFMSLKQNFSLATNAEITLEANPDDINDENLYQWNKSGINRLSIGVQSFRNHDLTYLNRVHTAERAIKCLHQAKDAGFENLTIDLIFGIPGLTDNDWEHNIQTALDLEIPHISAYSLTVEPRTALDLMIQKKQAAPVDEQQSARQFELLMQLMQKRGYEHYEISNFCLQGHYARHNTSYWKGEPYLGLGPSAHSFDGRSRQWNVSAIKPYLDAVKSNQIPCETEKLTTEQMYNEFVMTGLRTMWGCNTIEIEQQYGKLFSNFFSANAIKWINRGCVNKTGHVYTLTQQGKLLADGIASDLFMIENAE